MYALREMVAVTEMEPVPGLYDSRGSAPRWPMLVREVAAGWDPGAPAAVAADPADELYLLGERCAEAYMQADALQYRAMKLLAEYHRREGWRDTGFSSTAEWLANRIGILPNAARERVRTAVALERLPLTSRAMRDGELSFAKVRAVPVGPHRTARARSWSWPVPDRRPNSSVWCGGGRSWTERASSRRSRSVTGADGSVPGRTTTGPWW